MLNLPYYNIDLEKEYQYSYLLNILSRTLWLAKVREIKKVNFLLACKNAWISRRSANRYWHKGAYENKFIKYVSKDKECLNLTSKDNFDIIEKVPSYVYDNIKTITDLKDFLHIARLWRAWINCKKIKIVTWKWYRKIASETNSCKSTITHRNKRSISKFWLGVKKRYWVFNWLLVRLTNVYESPIRIIKNKYCAVKNSVKNSIKSINNDHFAPLLTAYKTKIAKKYTFAKSEEYEFINRCLYPNILTNN